LELGGPVLFYPRNEGGRFGHGSRAHAVKGFPGQ
jgi:hypothetical protein